MNPQGQESSPRTCEPTRTPIKNSTYPFPTNAWTFEHNCTRIVHRENCSICDLYMTHINDVELQPLNLLENSFPEIAREDQDLEFEFNRGRHKGRQEGERRFKACQAELTHARALVSKYKQKYEETQEQLGKKCDEVDRLRTASQGVKRRVQSSTAVDSSEINETSIRAEASEPALRSTTKPIQSPTTHWTSALSPPSQHLTVMVCELIRELGKRHDMVEAITSIVDKILLPDQPCSPVTQVENATKIVIRLVRSYAVKIRKIHPDRRTPAQKFLLTNLHDAQLLPPSNTIISPPYPRLVGPVYVDASNEGIGFVFENQWQIWGLNQGWQEPQRREIQWAEAVAVELGLRLMIRAGYSRQTINLFSDNQQVVDAISEGRSIGQSEAADVISLIRGLCRNQEITLDIRWIPGRENPADGPSRFRVEDSLGKRFPFDIKIPVRLWRFVANVQLESDEDVC